MSENALFIVSREAFDHDLDLAQILFISGKINKDQGLCKQAAFCKSQRYSSLLHGVSNYILLLLVRDAWLTLDSIFNFNKYDWNSVDILLFLITRVVTYFHKSIWISITATRRGYILDSTFQQVQLKFCGYLAIFNYNGVYTFPYVYSNSDQKLVLSQGRQIELQNSRNSKLKTK